MITPLRHHTTGTVSGVRFHGHHFLLLATIAVVLLGRVSEATIAPGSDLDGPPPTTCRVEITTTSNNAFSMGVWAGVSYSVNYSYSLCSESPIAPTMTVRLGNDVRTINYPPTGARFPLDISLTVPGQGTVVATLDYAPWSLGEYVLTTKLIWHDISEFTTTLCDEKSMGVRQSCNISAALPLLLLLFWVLPAALCAAFLALAAYRKYAWSSKRKATATSSSSDITATSNAAKNASPLTPIYKMRMDNGDSDSTLPPSSPQRPVQMSLTALGVTPHERFNPDLIDEVNFSPMGREMTQVYKDPVVATAATATPSSISLSAELDDNDAIDKQNAQKVADDAAAAQKAANDAAAAQKAADDAAAAQKAADDAAAAQKAADDAAAAQKAADDAAAAQKAADDAAAAQKAADDEKALVEASKLYSEEYQAKMLSAASNPLPATHKNIRPFVGFSLRQHEKDGGRLVVDGIYEGGPAHQQGIRVGDTVNSIDGEPVHSLKDVGAAVSKCLPASISTMSVTKGTDSKENIIVKVWVMTADPAYSDKPFYFDTEAHTRLGTSSPSPARTHVQPPAPHVEDSKLISELLSHEAISRSPIEEKYMAELAKLAGMELAARDDLIDDLESLERTRVVTDDDILAVTKDYTREYKELMMRREVPDPEEAVSPFIGFSLTESVEVDGNLLIESVYEGGPAYQVGMRPGDEVVAMENRRVRTIADAKKAVSCVCNVGRVTRITVRRPDEGFYVANVWIMTSDPRQSGKSYFFDVTTHNQMRAAKRSTTRSSKRK